MLKGNWVATQATGNFQRIPAGGYVLRITSVKNDEHNERLDVVFDIAEGEHKGAYANYQSDRDWAHTHHISHSEKSAGMFKRWLEIIEQSNPGFNIATWQANGCNERDFIGKVYGATWNERHVFRPWQDDQKKRTFVGETFARYETVEDIRAGKYNLPDEQWVIQQFERGTYEDMDEKEWKALTAIPGAAPTNAPAVEATVYDEDIPF